MTKSFIIVGQGLAGSILAYKLWQHGHRVTIIAHSKIPKASDVAAGLYNPLVFKRLTKSWMVDQCLPAMHKTYKEIEALLNEQFIISRDMIKPLSEQEEGLWKERILQENFSDFIHQVDFLKPLTGIHHFYAYGKVTKTGNVKLKCMLDALHNWFYEKNMLIDAPFHYDELKLSETGVNYQNIQADTIIFCEGYRVIENPYFSQVKLSPTKGELLEVYCEDLAEDFILNKKLFVLPVGNHHFKVGATYDWKNLNEASTEEAKKDLLKRFEELVNLPYQVVKQDAGIRPTVIDRRPILGKHPTHPQLAIFNGLGTKGIMLAPYFAEEMVKALTEDNYILSKEIDVQRFFK